MFPKKTAYRKTPWSHSNPFCLSAFGNPSSFQLNKSESDDWNIKGQCSRMHSLD